MTCPVTGEVSSNGVDAETWITSVKTGREARQHVGRSVAQRQSLDLRAVDDLSRYWRGVEQWCGRGNLDHLGQDRARGATACRPFRRPAAVAGSARCR